MQAQNFSAEFGRSMTSGLNLVYKSGGNNFHGSAFEFLRNSVLDANNFFANQRGVGLRQLQAKSVRRHGQRPDPPEQNFSSWSHIEGLAGAQLLRPPDHRSHGAGARRQLLRNPRHRDATHHHLRSGHHAPESERLAAPSAIAFPGNIIPAEPVRRRRAQCDQATSRQRISPATPARSRNNFYNSGAAAVNTDNCRCPRGPQPVTISSGIFSRFSYRRSFNAPPQLFPGDTWHRRRAGSTTTISDATRSSTTPTRSVRARVVNVRALVRAQPLSVRQPGSGIRSLQPGIAQGARQRRRPAACFRASMSARRPLWAATITARADSTTTDSPGSLTQDNGQALAQGRL